MKARFLFFFTVVYFLCSHVSLAQNLKDEDGKKHGKWVIKGKDRPKSGYESNAVIEEGTYHHGRKTGVWIKYNNINHLIASNPEFPRSFTLCAIIK